MSKKGFAKLVIAIGVLMMIFGMSMDVTVSSGYGRVANIHLISQKQTLMMLGGFVFLGGLILFGVARMKQTPEEEAKEEKKEQEAIQSGKRKANELIETGYKATVYLKSNWKELLKRLFAGMVIGVIAAALFVRLSGIARILSDVVFEFYYSVGGLIEWAIIVGSVAYVIRREDYIRVAKVAFAATAGAFGLLLLFSIVASNFLTLNPRVVPELTAYLSVSLISYFVAGKLAAEAGQAVLSTPNSIKRLSVAILIACLLLIIAVTFKLILKEQNRQAEVESNIKEAEIALVESGKRMGYWEQDITTGRLFGYQLGERNLQQLAVTLQRHIDTGELPKHLECSEDQCAELIGRGPLATAVRSIQFNFCIDEINGVDKNVAENYQLSKVSLMYKSESDASADFEYLKKRKLDMQQVDTETVIEVSLIPYVISVTRKRGKWDACGNQ